MDPRTRHDLPAIGMTWDQLQRQLDEFQSGDVDETHGGLTMYSLKGSEDVQRVAEQAWHRYFSKNALFCLAMPSIFTMEVQVCEMTLGLLGAGPEAKATLTSGGTESILCALHAMRTWAERQGRRGPFQVVAPETAHAAFSKGCHYLGLELIRVPCRNDWRADLDRMRGAVTPTTIGIIGSAPQWPHGRYDDAHGLAAIAVEHDLWFHLDGCFGGMLAPFVRQLGRPVPIADLSIAGVSSMSVDLHKYGYAAKPASIVAFASAELHAHLPYWVSDWPSGNYMTDTILGSRPAGAVAAAWAVMHYLGNEGYLGLARRTMEVKDTLSEGINALGMLHTWDSELSILTFEGRGVDIRDVAGAMSRRGWFTMGTATPPLMHLTVDPISDEWIDTYLADLGSAVANARSGVVNDGSLRYT